MYLLVALSGGSMLAWALHDLVEVDYAKLLSRSVLLLAAIGLWPLIRASGLRAGEVGLSDRPSFALWRPFALGIVTTLPLMLLFVVVGFRVADTEVDVRSLAFVSAAVLGLVSACLVALFEEVLFRGVLYAGLRRLTGYWSAAAAGSLLYAAAHFLQTTDASASPVRWYTGLDHALRALANVVEADWDSFLALTLIGVLLCWVRRTRGLWWCIALHAAWVWCIRLFKELTVRDVMSPYQVLVGGYDNFLGVAAIFWVAFLLVCIALAGMRQTAQP